MVLGGGNGDCDLVLVFDFFLMVWILVFGVNVVVCVFIVV